MYSTLFEVLVAPVITGVTLTLFAYWLNNRDD
ncbi:MULTISPECIES: type I toxin-antitoxin system Fst family toxin [Salinicoccus]|uniref:Type I toxin-antitoxin system Fst family toxin n=1 Tax=Salinicoccus roseus TaxID=45670 RepID=A0ABT4YI79_9STAP|nr:MULTISPECIES: type I toxin-antitoxin system Fst family toxin [Salinicoccus]MCC4723348.1 type I toxin-antitoxin system Fst family toxin [Salinicoccus sp. RF5]MDB0580536.1 type I toxin-antitoxin system Fst family toxin [Salinicoccus roseus]